MTYHIIGEAPVLWKAVHNRNIPAIIAEIVKGFVAGFAIASMGIAYTLVVW
jgi:hypothetical protein